MKRRQMYSANELFLGMAPEKIKIEDDVPLDDLLVIDNDGQKHEFKTKESLLNFATMLRQNIEEKADKICDHLEVLRTKNNKRKKIQLPMML